jgi:hypothetical protein
MRHFAFLAVTLTAALQAADPALLNMVMPDATVLAGINVQRAKTSPFGQFLLTQMPTGDGLDGFITATGFDPRQDLVEVLMASNNAQSNKSGLVLARGTFSPAKIAAAIAADSNHIAQTYNGAELITGTNAMDHGAVAFLSNNIAVAGDLASVKAAIDRSSGNNSIDPTLAAKVASFAAMDAWSVSISPISLGKNGDVQDNPIAGAMKTVQQASGSIMLSSPVVISAEALAASDQDATSLSDVLKFVMMMVQGNAQASLLNSLNVTTDHSTVKVQLSIPEDQLEQLIKSAKPDGEKAHKKPLAAHV